MILAQCGLRRNYAIFRRLAIGVALILSPALAVLCSQWDRKGAERAWEEATRLRDSLAGAPNPSRESYLKCIQTLRLVYYKDPHYTFSPEAVWESGRLYQEMGEKFANPSDFQSAARLFRFLLKDYEMSARCPDALLRLTRLSSGPLKDPAGAEEAAALLKKRFRSSPEARSLAGFEKTAAQAALSSKAPAAPPQAQPQASAEPKATATSSIKEVRFWSNPDYTRVSVVSDGPVQYRKSRLSNPERIFFDFSGASLERALLNKTLTVDDKFVKDVRIGQNKTDVVRIVLDLSVAEGYSFTDQSEPFGLTIEIRNKATAAGAPPPPAAVAVAGSKPAPSPTPQSAGTRLPQAEKAANAPPVTAVEGKPNPPAASATSTRPLETVELKATKSVESKGNISAAPPPKPSGEKPAVAQKGVTGAQADDPVLSRETPAAPGAAAAKDAAKASIPPAPVVPMPPAAPRTALPTSKGDRTLTRMLGLKIGRIVLDPGHGGYDTGTIGPGGLLEKDLVLQLAKDLQRMLEDKLGAEVILTRDNDAFISLEERTQIANKHQADLFVSIHANSSTIRTISGVETYFLDFARTDSAREVAARENATSDRNVRDLQNLIEKIAQADKLAESRELAAIIQKYLYRGVRKLIPSSQDRGVRSAPFVVLIGAHMPSVLAEVAFISNPRDEKLLRKDNSRQSLATALFQGIEGYMKTLGKAVAQNPAQFK